jgi:hypothetical protein
MIIEKERRTSIGNPKEPSTNRRAFGGKKCGAISC